MIPIKTKEMLLIQRSAEKTKPNYRKWKDRLFQASLWGAMSVCAVLTFSLIVYVAIKAVPNINLDFLLGQPSYIEDTIGIFACDPQYALFTARHSTLCRTPRRGGGDLFK